jgi:hypothetical protein
VARRSPDRSPQPRLVLSRLTACVERDRLAVRRPGEALDVGIDHRHDGSAACTVWPDDVDVPAVGAVGDQLPVGRPCGRRRDEVPGKIPRLASIRLDDAEVRASVRRKAAGNGDEPTVRRPGGADGARQAAYGPGGASCRRDGPERRTERACRAGREGQVEDLAAAGQPARAELVPACRCESPPACSVARDRDQVEVARCSDAPRCPDSRALDAVREPTAVRRPHGPTAAVGRTGCGRCDNVTPTVGRLQHEHPRDAPVTRRRSRREAPAVR